MNILRLPLFVYAALCLTSCYYSVARLDKVAAIRQSTDGKYKYEIQLVAHVEAHGNPHLQDNSLRHYDDDMWIYANEKEGVINATSGMCITATRNQTELASSLRGYLKFEADKLTVSLQTLMYGDGRKGDRFVTVPFNGVYEVRKAFAGVESDGRDGTESVKH